MPFVVVKRVLNIHHDPHHHHGGTNARIHRNDEMTLETHQMGILFLEFHQNSQTEKAEVECNSHAKASTWNYKKELTFDTWFRMQEVFFV